MYSSGHDLYQIKINFSQISNKIAIFKESRRIRCITMVSLLHPEKSFVDISQMFLIFHVLDLIKCNALALRTNFTSYDHMHLEHCI